MFSNLFCSFNLLWISNQAQGVSLLTLSTIYLLGGSSARTIEKALGTSCQQDISPLSLPRALSAGIGAVFLKPSNISVHADETVFKQERLVSVDIDQRGTGRLRASHR